MSRNPTHEKVRNKDEIIQGYLHDLHSIQRNLTCLVCLSLMTLPFVFSCSHTFCYGCSFEWLKSHKTCPTCRHLIRQKPILCHPIKEMCNVFIERQELLFPLGEGLLLRERQKEQDDLLKSHQSETFPGLFRDHLEGSYGGRVIDTGDYVMRCIRCHWEIEGPECTYVLLHRGLTLSD